MTTPVNFHFIEKGPGSAVVFLHGYPLSSAIWHKQQEGLSDKYRVITPDLRGHGQSPSPDGVYDMDTLAQDVLALLDSLELQKAVFFGHSMGGYVALALWRLAPQRFIALGLVDSQAAADSETARQRRFATAEKVFNDGSKVVAQAMMPKLFAPNVPEDETYVEQTRTIILNTKSSGIMGTLKGMAARPDSTPDLEKISVPVLIVSGDKDQIIPLEKAE